MLLSLLSLEKAIGLLVAWRFFSPVPGHGSSENHPLAKNA
jgi:hypothetical protein